MPPQLPKDAQKVFKGVIFDVYQWEQQLFDGSKATFERVVRPSSVGVIPITPDGQIIIIKDEQPDRSPMTTIVGGRMDEGEDPLEAARRELLEETGYKSKHWELWYSVKPGGSHLVWEIFTYIARDCRKVAKQKLDKGERISLRPVSFDQFLDLAANEVLKEKDITIKVLQAKLDPKKMNEIKKLFFG